MQVSAPAPADFGNLPAVIDCAWNMDRCIEAEAAMALQSQAQS
jgi:hypothetical protein